MRLLLDRPFSPAQLRESTELELRNISPEVWPTVLAQCAPRKLSLYHLTINTLDGIEAFSGLRELALEWAASITDVTPLYRLGNLQSLSITDFARLRSLGGIEKLSPLRELKLCGSTGSPNPPLRLVSIAPVTRLPNLRCFSLVNTRLDDDDITVLAHCRQLRYLKLANQFDRGQVAFLARRLNRQLAEPLTAYVHLLRSCETCNGRMAMFIGRKMPVLCHRCDRRRFERLKTEFAQLMFSA